jgi:hypothetical protein
MKQWLGAEMAVLLLALFADSFFCAICARDYSPDLRRLLLADA